MAQKLESLGRMEWHREYCQWVVAQTQIPKEPQDLEKIWRISGTHGLEPRQMAFVRAVWQWRQEQADKANMSPFRILHNEQLIRLALWAQQQEQIRPDTLPRLPKHCKGNRLRLLVESMQEAANLPPEQWPGPLRNKRGTRPSAEVLRKTELLKKACQDIAESLGLVPQLIASQKSMLAAIHSNSDTVEKLLQIGWMRWQADLLVEPLRAIVRMSPQEVKKAIR
jgi:ribonuclease D